MAILGLKCLHHPCPPVQSERSRFFQTVIIMLLFKLKMIHCNHKNWIIKTICRSAPTCPFTLTQSALSALFSGPKGFKQKHKIDWNANSELLFSDLIKSPEWILGSPGEHNRQWQVVQASVPVPSSLCAEDTLLSVYISTHALSDPRFTAALTHPCSAGLTKLHTETHPAPEHVLA